MTTRYETVADLEGLADGAVVNVSHATGIQSWAKQVGGLSRDGALVPFRMFTGVLQAGLVSDGTRALPEVGRWYTNVSATNYRFLIHAVTDDRVTYTLWNRNEVSRMHHTVSLAQWYQRRRIPVESADVGITTSLTALTQWATEYHRLRVQAQEAEVKARDAALVEAHKGQIQRIATRLGDSELHRVLNTLGWPLAHQATVTLTITGTVRLRTTDMQRAGKGSGIADATWGEVNAPFSLVVPVTREVEAGGCACGTNQTWMVETARTHVTSEVRNLRVTGVCDNH